MYITLYQNGPGETLTLTNLHLEPHDYRIYYVNVNIDSRHQYGISVAESQTLFPAKCRKLRGARRNGCFLRLKPVEHISLMPTSYLSLNNTHQDACQVTQVNSILSYSLRLSQSGSCGRQRPQKWKKRGRGGIGRRPLPSFPYPTPFFPISAGYVKNKFSTALLRSLQS